MQTKKLALILALLCVFSSVSIQQRLRANYRYTNFVQQPEGAQAQDNSGNQEQGVANDNSAGATDSGATDSGTMDSGNQDQGEAMDSNTGSQDSQGDQGNTEGASFVQTASNRYIRASHGARLANHAIINNHGYGNNAALLNRPAVYNGAANGVLLNNNAALLNTNLGIANPILLNSATNGLNNIALTNAGAIPILMNTQQPLLLGAGANTALIGATTPLIATAGINGAVINRAAINGIASPYILTNTNQLANLAVNNAVTGLDGYTNIGVSNALNANNLNNVAATSGAKYESSSSHVSSANVNGYPVYAQIDYQGEDFKTFF